MTQASSSWVSTSSWTRRGARPGLLALALGAVGLLIVAAASAPATRVGVLDPDRIRRESKTISAELSKASAPAHALQEQLQARQQELQKAVEQYESQKSVTAAETNQQRQADLLKQRQAVETLARQLDELTSKTAQESLGPMRQRVEQAITTIARERGIDIVLPASGVIYRAPELDLTDPVIAHLDAAPAKP